MTALASKLKTPTSKPQNTHSNLRSNDEAAFLEQHEEVIRLLLITYIQLGV
jgi:hypothetical protein